MTKEPRTGLVWAGAMIALALGATFAHRQGIIEGDTVIRLVVGVNGLMIAWYGNLLPKAFAPNASVRQIARLGGWSQVLGGLVYAGLWAFAPIPVALAVGSFVVVLGIAVPVVYCLRLRAKAKAG